MRIIGACLINVISGKETIYLIHLILCSSSHIINFIIYATEGKILLKNHSAFSTNARHFPTILGIKSQKGKVVRMSSWIIRCSRSKKWKGLGRVRVSNCQGTPPGSPQGDSGETGAPPIFSRNAFLFRLVSFMRWETKLLTHSRAKISRFTKSRMKNAWKMIQLKAHHAEPLGRLKCSYQLLQDHKDVFCALKKEGNFYSYCTHVHPLFGYWNRPWALSGHRRQNKRS